MITSVNLKGTLCRNFSHLAVKLYFAFKQIVLPSASRFQIFLIATTVAIMYQEAMTCLPIPLHRVVFWVMKFVISNKLQTTVMLLL